MVKKFIEAGKCKTRTVDTVIGDLDLFILGHIQDLELKFFYEFFYRNAIFHVYCGKVFHDDNSFQGCIGIHYDYTLKRK